MKAWLNDVAKALTALIVTGAGTLQLAMTQGSDGGTSVTANEWVNIVANAVVAGFAVWAIPNGYENAKAAVTGTSTK
jgi:hypothetical protein